VRSGVHPMFRKRRPDVCPERTMGCSGTLHQSGVRGWFLRNDILYAPCRLLRWNQRTVLHRSRCVRDQAVPGPSMHRRRLRRYLQSNDDTVQRQRRADVQHPGPVGSHRALHESSLPRRRVHRRLRTRNEAVFRKRRRDVRRQRAVELSSSVPGHRVFLGGVSVSLRLASGAFIEAQSLGMSPPSIGRCPPWSQRPA
jgi:hypothetical protein